MSRTHIIAYVALATTMVTSASLAQKYPPVQPDPAQPDPAQPDPVQPDSVQPDTVQPDTVPAPSPAPEPDDDGGSASEGAAEVIRRSTNPHFFVGAVGPSFFGLNTAERAPGFRQTAFIRGKVALDYGYHVSGDAEGFALGLTIEQSFDGNFYIFNPGFKMWWDIQVTDDMGIYIAPFAKLGYALAACDGCGTNDHAFNLAIGAEGRIVLEDKWMLLFRPVQLDTYLGDFFDEVFLVNYDILIGGGLTF